MSITTRARRGLATALAGALAAGGLVALAGAPAQAAETTTSDATFTWGVNGYAQDGIFGPWTFTNFTGDAKFLEGSVVNSTPATAPVSPANPKPQTEYNVAPVPDTSFPTSKAGRKANAVQFTGGDGTIDRATGAAELSWDGSYTVNAYPAMYKAPNEIYSDPELTVNADGSGELTMDFTIGAGQDMAGNPFPAKDFGRLQVATFDAGSLSARSTRGFRVTPDYAGVDSGIENQVECETGVSGSWPREFVTALNSDVSGQSVVPHFYSTGCGGRNDTKPPLPIDVRFQAKGQVAVSKNVFNAVGTQTVTVTGSKFDPAANTGGSQAPFSGDLSAGVYVAFGRFAEVFDPSAGVAGSARALADDAAQRNGVSVKWAVPAASFPGAIPTAPQDPASPAYTELKPDGSFTTTLQINKAWISAQTGNWGIYTYRGGNATSLPEFATFTPITFVEEPPVVTPPVTPPVVTPPVVAPAAPAKVSVKRGATTKPTTRRTGKTSVTLTATNGAPVTGKVMVSFKKSGQKTKIKTVTVKGGKASVTIPKLGKGTWRVYVKYTGTKYFAKTATLLRGSFKVTR
jgi:hypothetical protein